MKQSTIIGGDSSFHYVLLLNNNGTKADLIANWNDAVMNPLVAVKGNVVG